MSDERILRLVSEAADGLLGEAQLAELDRLLRNSPEGRRFRAELTRMETLLGRVPAVEPPESLHRRIIAAAAPPAAGKARRPLSDWLHALAPVPVLRYGLSAAAGLLLAVMFYENRLPHADHPDIDDLVGTMVQRKDATDAEVLASRHFRSARFDSRVSVERRARLLLLGIDIEAQEPVDIAIDLASAGAAPGALMQSGGPVEFFDFADQVLRVRTVGRIKVTVLLRREDDTAVADKATIRLEFSSNGKLLQQGALEPAW